MCVYVCMNREGGREGWVTLWTCGLCGLALSIYMIDISIDRLGISKHGCSRILLFSSIQTQVHVCVCVCVCESRYYHSIREPFLKGWVVFQILQPSEVVGTFHTWHTQPSQILITGLYERKRGGERGGDIRIYESPLLTSPGFLLNYSHSPLPRSALSLPFILIRTHTPVVCQAANPPRHGDAPTRNG